MPSFSFVKQYAILRINTHLIINLFVYRHLSVPISLYRTTRKVDMKMSLGMMWSSQSICVWVECLGQIVVLFSFFLRNYKTDSTVAVSNSFKLICWHQCYADVKPDEDRTTAKEVCRSIFLMMLKFSIK